MSIWVSSSDNDPNAIYKNLQSSFSPFLPEPSAILDGMETAALRI